MSQSNINKAYENPGLHFLETALHYMPAAYAELTGNPGNAEITGIVRFYPVGDGVLQRFMGFPFPLKTAVPLFLAFISTKGILALELQVIPTQMQADISIQQIAPIRRTWATSPLCLEITALLG